MWERVNLLRLPKTESALDLHGGKSGTPESSDLLSQLGNEKKRKICVITMSLSHD